MIQADPLLSVFRTYSDGRRMRIGRCAQNSQGIYFAWDAAYVAENPAGNLSPFQIPFTSVPHLGPDRPNNGLHGFLADSLPDGWGRLLMDKAFLRHDINPATVSPLERLAFVGNRGVGALSFEPQHPAADQTVSRLDDIAELGHAAARLFVDHTRELLPQLRESGASGGSRPKALLWFSENFSKASTHPFEGAEAWLVKFTADSLPLAHEESIWENAALAAAQEAGIRTVDFALLETSRATVKHGRPVRWLAVKRFDVTARGRLHFASAAGLLDADFRLPALDYTDLVRLTQVLTKNRSDVVELVRRAIFNFMILNCDDHAKNFGFLMDDAGSWRLSPAYDVTYSPDAYHGEHAASFAGCGRTVTQAAAQKMASVSSLTSAEIRSIAEQAAAGAERFVPLALDLGATKSRASVIRRDVQATIRATLEAFA